MAATVNDVARLARVSIATVSRVVNASGSVTDKTKEKVICAISQLGYSLNEHAASLSRNRAARKRDSGVDGSLSGVIKVTPRADRKGRSGCSGECLVLVVENRDLRKQVAQLGKILNRMRGLAEKIAIEAAVKKS